MPKIVFKGWNYGLEKISLTKLFQKQAGFRLKEAKTRTDALLDGQTFVIEIESVEKAEEFVEKATAIGAVCEIIKDND